MPVNSLPVAVGQTVGSPVLGQPLLIAFSRAAVSLIVGAPDFGRPLLVRYFTQIDLKAVSKSVGSLTFTRPAITQIRNIVPLRALASPSLQAGRVVFGDPVFTQAFHGGGDMRGLPAEPSQATPYYREINAIWPDLLNQRALISPARNGVNRETGKIWQGWDHVEQSMKVIFATPFHERILRRWVGSYVPYILGETYVQRIVTRFFWAISVSIDLWEPNYRIKQVFFMNDALGEWSPKTLDAVGEYRLGHGIFRTEGVYRPRAHLGDSSVYQPRAVAIVGHGTEIWDPAIATP
jgi:phage baseplate assembly protein W